MVCAVFLSSAILLGASEINVQAADVASDSTSTVKDEENPIDSGAPDPVFGGIHWAVYAINGDKNDLQLRLGNPGSDEVDQLDSTSQNTDFDWYLHRNEISSVVIVGNIKTDAKQEYLFSSMKKLTSITGLNKLDTSNTTDFSHMFDGDLILSSVDLSELNMSAASNTYDMFANTNVSTLTLGNSSVITSSSGLPTQYELSGHTYKSSEWQDKSDSQAAPITDSELISKYPAKSNQNPQTTWTRANSVEQPNYYIQYVDNSTGKIIPGAIYDETGKSGAVGDLINLSTYYPAMVGKLQSGYSSVLANPTGKIELDESGKYYVKALISPLAPVNISVNEQVGSETPKDQSFKIPVNDTSYKYADITNPSNSTIDLNKSTIKIGDGKAESFADYSATSKDLNSILSTAIKSQFNKSGVFGDDTAGTTPITVNAVYTKNSTSGGSSSGNHTDSGDDNNSEDKGGTTTEVKQTVSTTTKDVRLYDKNGKLITNRALAENSAWFSDQKYTLDGVLYYRVANDEYVKASDVYVYTAEDHIVDTKGRSIVYLVDSKGHKVTDRALSPNTEWYTDRYTIINGQKYYRVATNEFVSAADVSLL